MASLNKVFLMGNLTRDPDLRFTPGGTAVCEFGIAINRRFGQPNGQEKEETCFLDIVVWGKQAESSARFLQKGANVFIEGRLVFDQWQEKDTQKKRSRIRVTAERVQFLARRDDAGSEQGGGYPDEMSQDAPSGYSARPPMQARSSYPQRGGYQQQSYGAPRTQQRPPVPAQQAAAPQDGGAPMPPPVEENPFDPVEGVDDDIPF